MTSSEKPKKTKKPKKPKNIFPKVSSKSKVKLSLSNYKEKKVFQIYTTYIWNISYVWLYIGTIIHKTKIAVNCVHLFFLALNLKAIKFPGPYVNTHIHIWKKKVRAHQIFYIEKKNLDIYPYFVCTNFRAVSCATQKEGFFLYNTSCIVCGLVVTAICQLAPRRDAVRI